MSSISILSDREDLEHNGDASTSVERGETSRSEPPSSPKKPGSFEVEVCEAEK